MATYKTYREFSWLKEEKLLTCVGDYTASEPTITHPIDMAQEGQPSNIECLEVWITLNSVAVNIADELTDAELDDLIDEFVADVESRNVNY